MTTSSSARVEPATAAAKPKARGKRRDAEYIPAHLRTFVFHSQDDFYVSRFFDPVLMAHLMFEGFLPIASEFRDQCFLLPKLHRQRCIQLIAQAADGDADADATLTPEHVPKSVKKRARKYALVLNRDFDAVVAGCHEQHGIPWLYPPMVEGFRALFQAGDDGIELFPGRIVRFFSVELRDVETDALAAGELGYTVGRSYTSLTGFSRVNGAGTVQLHALGRLLFLCGMKMWDLGMSMPYKMSLGANDVDRDDFLEHLYRWRDEDCFLQLQSSEGDLRKGKGVHTKTLFEISRAPQVMQRPSSSADGRSSCSASGRSDSVSEDNADDTASGSDSAASARKEERQEHDSDDEERERKKTKRSGSDVGRD